MMTAMQEADRVIRDADLRPLDWRPTGRREMGRGWFGHIVELTEQRRLAHLPGLGYHHQDRWADTRTLGQIIARILGRV